MKIIKIHYCGRLVNHWLASHFSVKLTKFHEEFIKKSQWKNLVKNVPYVF